MESLIQSLDSTLLTRLDFNLSSTPVAKYLTQRDSVTWMASGASEYSPQGTRTIRLPLNGQGQWLDPSTLKIFYTLKSTHTTPDVGANIGGAGTKYAVTPRGSPATFFQRIRLLSGSGVVLEDIQNHARVATMFELCTSPHVRELEQSEGFGPANQGLEDKNVSYLEKLGDKHFGGQAYVPQGQEVTVCFSPIFGLFSSNTKFLPLSMMKGLIIELELADADAPVHTDYTIKEEVTTTGGAEWTPTYNIKAKETGVVSNWLILNPQAKGDVVVLDPEIDSQYYSHLASGGRLNIPFQAVASMVQSIAPSGGVSQFSLTRTASRVKSVFISFLSGPPPAEGGGLDTIDLGDLCFWGPGGLTKGTASNAYSVKYQIQIGSRVFPIQKTGSVAENVYNLRKACGSHGSALHGMSFNRNSYMSTSMLLAADMEAALDASFSGLSTKNSELVVCRIEGLDPLSPGTWGTAQQAHVVLTSDAILSISDMGPELYD